MNVCRSSAVGRRWFRRAVTGALRSLPHYVQRAIENVAVVIEEEPSPDDLAGAGLAMDETLFGIYRGIPLTARGTNYHLVAPDTIALFRRPLLAACRTERELVEEIRRTVLHEVGHYFGLDEAALAALEGQ